MDSVDAYVLGMPSPVNKKRRCLFAVVTQRQALVGQPQNPLRDLGLERRARDVTDLRSYLAAKRPADTPTQQPSVNPVIALHPPEAGDAGGEV